MNKKIYLDTKFILITDEIYQPSDNQLIVNTQTETEVHVSESIKKFIQQNDKINLILLSKNVLHTFDFLKKEFTNIEAAGGLIKNNITTAPDSYRDGVTKYLFIYRLNKWDLPKGKMDAGETIPETALRECEEECGVQQLKILNELAPSYHIYRYKGANALKTTHWFLMETAYDGPLVPQANENIEKAQWLAPEEINSMVISNTYPAILDMILVNIK